MRKNRPLKRLTTTESIRKTITALSMGLPVFVGVVNVRAGNGSGLAEVTIAEHV
jgi:hypothetical protein